MEETKPKKILVIDDETVLVDLLRTKISQQGFEVIEAHDGDEGLKKALSEHPDLILLDIIMPKVDGVTMLKQLRNDEWGKNARVIILSNLITAESVEKSLSSGAYDYLVKIDYTLDDLIDIIKKRIERGTAADQNSAPNMPVPKPQ